jgi:molybdate transport system substrate-binding protein
MLANLDHILTGTSTMMKKTIFALILVLLTSCFSDNKKTTTFSTNNISLLMYCGITMVRPMNILAKRFEKKHGINIKISQGGSRDLYDSLKASRIGDLYLPGAPSYREKNLGDGLLGDFVFLGHNRASFVVPKGNPKGITSDLKQLIRKDLRVVICDAKTGSIGRETKKILDNAGIYKEVLANASFLTTDSRNLNRAIKDNKADIVINWKATSRFLVNRDFLESIEIDEKYANSKKLLLNALTFSKHPKETKMFMDFASSPEGLAVFKEYGF